MTEKRTVRRCSEGGCTLMMIGVLLVLALNLIVCQDTTAETLTANDINIDALFQLLARFESPEIQKAYKDYLRQHLNRDFEKFIRTYPEIREGLLQAFNKMLADENLCQNIGCADAGMENREILAQIFPGVFSLAAASPDQPPAGQTEAPVQTLPSPNGQGSIVFLDGSGSMKGYFSNNTGNPTNFQKFLLTEFRNVLSSESELVPLNLCHFGMELKTPVPVTTFDFSQKDFPEASTNIIKVFRSEEFSDYPLAIVITDGIQSDPKGGFDSGGVLRAIQDKLDEGFQVYLIGVRADFNGYVYPEIPPKEKFIHTGLRPMYIWIAGRDVELTQRIATTMFNEVKEFVQFDIDVGMVKLGQKDIPECPQIQKITLPEKSSLHIAVWNDQENRYDLLLRAPQKAHSIDIPIDLKVKGFDSHLWQLRMYIDGVEQLPWANLASSGDTQWVLSILYNDIPQQRDNFLKLQASGTFELHEEEWWREWSTNDDTQEENADKSLYLEELVSRLIVPPQTTTFEIGSLNLAIRKK